MPVIQGSDTDEILVCSNVGSGQNIADKQIDSINNAGYSVFAWGPESNGLYYTKPVSRDSTFFFTWISILFVSCL
jgi:hypothetical protein